MKEAQTHLFDRHEVVTEWEKVFANDMTKTRLILKIYKQLLQLNIKNKQPA